jgi:ferrous iron transport protein B
MSDKPALPTLALVGNPNVGKSVMFYNLTGRYVTVSNYPGSTIEVTRGQCRVGDTTFEVVDTPGMYSLMPLTDEERVARRILLEGEPGVVLHMVDAKNLGRMLPLTVQLLELGLPVILVLNMTDEAERLGVEIDAEGLSRDLGIPVVPTVSVAKRGMRRLRAAIEQVFDEPSPCSQGGVVSGGQAPRRVPVHHEPAVERAIEAVAPLLPERFVPHGRALTLLLLQRDEEVESLLEAEDPDAAATIANVVQDAIRPGRSPIFAVARARQALCTELTGRHLRVPTKRRQTLADRLGELTINPIFGVPIVLLVVYFGLYKFVGVLGAGVLVDLLEKKLFGAHVIPWFDGVLHDLLPGESGWRYWLRELFGGRYGVVSMGVTYALTIVMPIVSMFFLFFSVLEDSGYFPRLAMLVDRLFKRIGLNGRAVIPVVLGFGCGTMATMVTRIQETRRERIITTFLLALAIPCSAQFGVITGLLAQHESGVLGLSYVFLVWMGIFFGVFLLAGRLLSRLLPGPPASFYMELPALRMPRLANVLVKTVARVKWYFMEVLPLFVFASVLVWVGRLTGLFDLLVAGMRHLVLAIGLPAGAGEVFLYGFFRRDLGAAGLYKLNEAGQLDGVQLLVASVTLTLFMPCVAQFLIMKKERGLRASLIMAGAIFVIAFAVGGALNLFFTTTGIRI